MNQYSCQNCKREHNAHLCVYCAIRLSEYDKEFLEVVGCASHSDFQSERDKVLDIICEWLRYNDPKGLYHYIKNELRQKVGELQYQCGDDCQGECSGEVTGTPFCPQSERDNQQDTTYELCNFWKLHACKSMTTNNCWNKSCPDHDEYGSPCSFQSERDKVLDDYCIIDLTYYVWGEAESDDVRLCQGKGCNYCGRYNAELRRAGEP